MRILPMLVPMILMLSACDTGGGVSGADSASPTAASGNDSQAVVRPSAPLAAEIPAAFQGQWDSDPLACGQDVSEMRLIIAADGLRFYESVAKVDAVGQPEPGRIEIDAAVDAEGITQGRHFTLTLREDGRLATTIDGSTALRVRCDGVVPR